MAWLEVVLPGHGSDWDAREEDLRMEVEEYLGTEYDAVLREAIQDADGRFWTNIEIRISEPSDPPVEQEICCMSTWERGCRCDQCTANHDEEGGL